ncbi:hypothetical protein Hanom_Chr06g00537811 [Helianthus anomalus]
MDDLDQMHPEDVEEMDITSQMAMAKFRAKSFVKKIGRNKWQNQKYLGSPSCELTSPRFAATIVMNQDTFTELHEASSQQESNSSSTSSTCYKEQ